MPKLTVSHETWPVAGAWTISRGAVTEIDLVIVELTEGGHRGRGECRPYPRYRESVESVTALVESRRPALERGVSREELQALLPAGAARNALDCALWDLEAKRAGVPAWRLAGLAPPRPVTTAYSLSLDSPEAMGAAAARNATRPLLKLKLAGSGDLERVQAVRANAPQARIIVDANEAWSLAQYRALAPKLAALGVALVEQPLHADHDEELAGVERPVPLCADESCHDSASLDRIRGRYDLVNIKLDKTGGLTEALRLKARAEAAGLGVMVGCMLATSLAMAPALLVAQGAQVVDLDGPLLLARDRSEGLRFEGSLIHPPDPELWG